MCRRRALVLWLVLLSGLVLRAQQEAPKIPPIWPGPSFDPRTMPGQYVYLTPEKNALIIYDPARVKEKGLGARCWLLPLLNEAKPRVSARESPMRGQALVVVMLLGSLWTAKGQSPRMAGLSPVPVLPPTGQPDRDGQFVYLGPTIYELTVFYPRRASDGTLLGYEKSVRIPLMNGVAPQVSVEISRAPDGKFVYRYLLMNLPQARQGLARWWLRLPVDAGSIEAPPGWQVAGAEQIREDYQPKGAEVMSPLRPLVTVTWFTNEPLKPGEKRGGFVIRSQLAPAVIQGYASAGDFRIPDDLPEEVRKQLEVWQQPEWQWCKMWVIGPRYAPDFPRTVAANEFATALEVMSFEGVLDRNSPFVQQGVERLRFLASGKRWLPTSIDQTFLALATTPKEKELAEAIRLALFEE